MADVIQALEVDSHSINKVVQAIQDIAEQTNLLALNALSRLPAPAIMVSSFAVVADEVYLVLDTCSTRN